MELETQIEVWDSKVGFTILSYPSTNVSFCSVVLARLLSVLCNP